MKNKLIIFALILLLPASAFAISGEEIVRKADDKATYDSAEMAGEMRITDRFGTKTSTFNSWSRGENESLIEFTSLAERGQKVLRTENEIYLYYPDAEELIRMQGSALRQGMLGSDISYEDMTGGKDRASQYKIEVTGSETILGRDCWVLSLEARTRSVPYPKETVWIDKQDYIVMKGEYFTKSGRLLKEMEVLELGEIDGITLALETKISDKMKRDSDTILIVKDLKANVALDDAIFSLEELSW
ncbi:MAG: outer membrane lipoprotein-sorting protein [Spirochaetales bacterium]|uniref:Outer membrane lipoprotein-sorting protein n=1 Tax=Candidatus Thalassospirochaeta sargassi TaxID=3119039 RepID=A0AAJ1IBQ3_9SPIO|nr:outer membrane lipoprotein-sorting protein [Spirochaetales bacterium]